ncbi:exonuclease domain-containing protein, partial [Klebsiella oxytoca]|uniref:exonuclease domain-containing protein n=1 Tax=Klebsiella oxytoca TaxID=571 RepID=UPI0021B09AD9
MTDGKKHFFLFHDYETFGTSPSLDRPSQFAAIRTDEDLNVVGEPEVFYCRRADDY